MMCNILVAYVPQSHTFSFIFKQHEYMTQLRHSYTIGAFTPLLPFFFYVSMPGWKHQGFRTQMKIA